MSSRLEAVGAAGRLLSRLAWIKVQPDGRDELRHAWRRAYGTPAPEMADPDCHLRLDDGRHLLVYRLEHGAPSRLPAAAEPLLTLLSPELRALVTLLFVERVRIVVHADAPDPWGHREDWIVLDNTDQPAAIDDALVDVGKRIGKLLGF